ncbi:hypothetical protein [Chitinophaga sp. LS1]|uniref:hypothetical protein n=1 Tax=Chitinophaga sp. LS1 TaxID=3051176 RepID=UPI002AAA7437|nr:hypothetical protein [Chitinophaga sp. LS1]WPV64000.1 hypothetical protein QQL36_19555 [Chitinophaga sp. LS1]
MKKVIAFTIVMLFLLKIGYAQKAYAFTLESKIWHKKNISVIWGNPETGNLQKMG